MSVKSGGYLLLGEDEWSKKKYIEQIKEEILTPSSEMMNYYVATEKEVMASSVEDFMETLPFFAEQKVVLLKDTGLFKAGRKEESEKFEKLFLSIPDYIVLLLDEKEVDKRSRLYKYVKAHFEIVAFDYPGEEAVVKILMEQAVQEKLQVDSSVLYYLVRHMPSDIGYILGEWEKLKAFTENKTITKAMIDQICVFSLETRVFELVKKIAQGESDEALSIYARMLQSKESPIGILVLVARQFRMMYQVKYLKAQKQDQKKIAAQMKMPYFAVKDMLQQVNAYGFRELEKVLSSCLETDRFIKTGQMDAGKAVEVLILEALKLRK